MQNRLANTYKIFTILGETFEKKGCTSDPNANNRANELMLSARRVADEAERFQKKVSEKSVASALSFAIFFPLLIQSVQSNNPNWGLYLGGVGFGLFTGLRAWKDYRRGLQEVDNLIAAYEKKIPKCYPL